LAPSSRGIVAPSRLAAYVGELFRRQVKVLVILIIRVRNSYVSELIVFVFRDEYRAPEVLNELRRRAWDWADNLDDAVTVTLNKMGRAKIQLNIDLSTSEAVAWAGMWGSLIGVTLFLPLTELIVEVADSAIRSSRVFAETRRNRHVTIPDARWWREHLYLSEDFTRDVAAFMSPGHSAIFMLLRAKNPSAVLQQLRNYGDTIIHTSLSTEQDEKMQARLAIE
jgi:uncharacterized membrane protein